MLVQHTEICKVVKREIAIFLFITQNIDCGYTLEPPRPGGSYEYKMKIAFFFLFLLKTQNIDCVYTLEPPRPGDYYEYPQSIFWSKYKKNRYTPAYPSFAI